MPWLASLARCMLAATCCATVVACAGRTGTTAGTVRPPPIRVQVLAINDFHGHLEPPSGLAGVVGDVPAGGSAYLASHLARLRALNPNTVLKEGTDRVGGPSDVDALERYILDRSPLKPGPSGRIASVP